MSMAEIISIVLNATVGVLVVGYGIWLKQIIERQLGLKDSTIETLNTTIQGYIAEITRLKAETTPAVVTSYQTVKTYADQMAASNNDLTASNNELTARIKEFEKAKPVAAVVSKDLWTAEKDGFQAGTDIFSAALRPYTKAGGRVGNVTAAELLKFLQDYVAGIQKWSDEHIAKAKVIEVQLKELPKPEAR